MSRIEPFYEGAQRQYTYEGGATSSKLLANLLSHRHQGEGVLHLVLNSRGGRSHAWRQKLFALVPQVLAMAFPPIGRRMDKNLAEAHKALPSRGE